MMIFPAHQEYLEKGKEIGLMSLLPIIIIITYNSPLS